MFIFAALILVPVHVHFVGPISLPHTEPPNGNSTLLHQTSALQSEFWASLVAHEDEPDQSWSPEKSYLWSYLVFTYFFTFLAIYYMNSETFNIIQIRQDYLGTQSTVTDKTFRLSGIPVEFRSEEKIKELIEKLEIGRVESVTICRRWGELDKMMAKRAVLLRKLEESWSAYHGQKPTARHRRPSTGLLGQPSNDGGYDNGLRSENAREESPDEEVNGPGPGEGSPLLGNSATVAVRSRPTVTLRYGFLKLRSRTTDAIDYYEERLRQIDQKILAARKKEYEPTDTAFVTMDSIAACQMAIQALVDPHPGRFLTKPAPAPSDVVWENTYMPRVSRRLRSWAITIFVAFLSVVWLVPVGALASLLSLCSIRKFSEPLAESLTRHKITKALVQTGLPTAVVSLLNVCVPYLYWYLSYHQGMISKGDIELSVISKNFFFTFFNIFLVFSAFGTIGNAIPVLRDSLVDSTKIGRLMADNVRRIVIFYLNLVMLQGIGLIPLRLLEFGSVSLYPILRLGAKTPRDRASIDKPPDFNYGFYLPTALLIYILCLVYSVLPDGVYVLGLGIVYFILGYFTYKYQLLYAMDQPQHATGGAWRLICRRIVLGLIVFQIVMSGVLSIESAYTEALLIIPLGIMTLWYGYYWSKRFDGLTRFIALRSIERGGAEAVAAEAEGAPAEGITTPEQRRELLHRLSTVDEEREEGQKFINPSLILPYVLLAS